MPAVILLVDDEKDFLEPLAERLSIRGFNVHTAFDGEEALAALDTLDADLVILDVLMPGKSGIDILREIKRTKPFTEVIMLTGRAAAVETAIEGIKLGAYDYLMKPTELVDLIDKVDKAILRKRKHEQRNKETG